MTQNENVLFNAPILSDDYAPSSGLLARGSNSIFLHKFLSSREKKLVAVFQIWSMRYDNKIEIYGAILKRMQSI